MDIRIDGQEQTTLIPSGDQTVEVRTGCQVMGQWVRRKRRSAQDQGALLEPLGQVWRSSPTLRQAWLGTKPARSTRRASVPAGPSSRPGVTTASTAPVLPSERLRRARIKFSDRA